MENNLFFTSMMSCCSVNKVSSSYNFEPLLIFANVFEKLIYLKFQCVLKSQENGKNVIYQTGQQRFGHNLKPPISIKKPKINRRNKKRKMNSTTQKNVILFFIK